MRLHRRLRCIAIATGAAAVALLFGATPATAAPTETVLAVPLAGIGVGVTGLPSAGYYYITATTDPDTPGVTRFGPYAGVFVHWRNISTGAAGVTYLDAPGADVRTGPGIVFAAVTLRDDPGPRGVYVPGAGAWSVP
jgi:hypothetical protein